MGLSQSRSRVLPNRGTVSSDDAVDNVNLAVDLHPLFLLPPLSAICTSPPDSPYSARFDIIYALNMTASSPHDCDAKVAGAHPGPAGGLVFEDICFEAMTIPLVLEKLPARSSVLEREIFFQLHLRALVLFAGAFKRFRSVADSHAQPLTSTYYDNLTEDSIRMESYLIERGLLDARSDTKTYATLAQSPQAKRTRHHYITKSSDQPLVKPESPKRGRLRVRCDSETPTPDATPTRKVGERTSDVESPSRVRAAKPEQSTGWKAGPFGFFKNESNVGLGDLDPEDDDAWTNTLPAPKALWPTPDMDLPEIPDMFDELDDVEDSETVVGDELEPRTSIASPDSFGDEDAFAMEHSREIAAFTSLLDEVIEEDGGEGDDDDDDDEAPWDLLEAFPLPPLLPMLPAPPKVDVEMTERPTHAFGRGFKLARSFGKILNISSTVYSSVMKSPNPLKKALGLKLVITHDVQAGGDQMEQFEQNLETDYKEFKDWFDPDDANVKAFDEELAKLVAVEELSAVHSAGLSVIYEVNEEA
ncbi:hypothetical protein DFP72DRAFT_1072824 [Ephemerocybe angulata]|uniref:Uncharacterized protein n=1 Tax=Ephemerocybe angulata TaxID=980116 RepID=A0A8H6M2J5_9AGAR|nr:hypothetical protein DFP72DRAFT_1072824 [Tulosesus angulatus]